MEYNVYQASMLNFTQTSPKRGGRGHRSKLPCKPGMERNPDTNRCIRSENIGKVNPKAPRKINSAKSPQKCKEGFARNPVTKRCRRILTPSLIDSKSGSLTESQRIEFDKMLHIMRQPVGKRPQAHQSCKPEPVDIQACLTNASITMLKTEMSRRGYKVASPVVNVLIPRKKGEPRP
jgi:hypothetical protein